MSPLLYIWVLPLFVSLYLQVLLDPKTSLNETWLIIGMVVTGVVSLIAARIGFTAMFNHEERMTTRLSRYAMDGLLSHSHAFFSNTKVGSLAGDLNSFSRSYLSLLDTIFLQASSIVVNFLASLVIIAIVAPIMLPIMILLTISVVVLAIRSYSRRNELRTMRKEMQSKLMGLFGDIIGNQTLVRMFGRKEHELGEIVRQREKIEAIAKKEIVILENGAELRLGVLIGFQVITLVLCGWLLRHDMLSIAGLVFIVTYLGRITGSLFAINSAIRTAEQAFLDAAKITEILSAPVGVEIGRAHV